MGFKRKAMYSTNTSGFKGVNWSKEKGMWHAKIGVNYKRIHLGYFETISEAAHAYEKAVRKYEGEKK